MTVLEVIQRSSDFLARKGVESPRLQIELLLAYLWQVPRLKLYLNFERGLTESELENLRELVKRRGEREPLQHLIGSTSFCGLELAVNRSALIPRPETELLAERAWEFLQKRTAQNGAAPRVLDFGTGTGCLAISLASHCPQAEMHALDISEEALNLARQNAFRHKVEERIHFHFGDGFAVLPASLRFDLLVSNPPYIPSGEIESLQPEVRDYEPHLALDGGKDGLTFFRRLAVEALPFLAPESSVMLEFGEGQEDKVRGIFLEQHWGNDRVEQDYSGRPRILIASRPH